MQQNAFAAIICFHSQLACVEGHHGSVNPSRLSPCEQADPPDSKPPARPVRRPPGVPAQTACASPITPARAARLLPIAARTPCSATPGRHVVFSCGERYRRYWIAPWPLRRQSTVDTSLQIDIRERFPYRTAPRSVQHIITGPSTSVGNHCQHCPTRIHLEYPPDVYLRPALLRRYPSHPPTAQ